MTKSSKYMRRQWQDPEMRERMLAGLLKGSEASRNQSQHDRIERGIRISRALKLKRLEAHGPVR